MTFHDLLRLGHPVVVRNHRAGSGHAFTLFVMIDLHPNEYTCVATHRFGKALPVLSGGGYLHENDVPAARSVLRAAALTYVASALVTLLDLTRLIRILR